MATSLSRPPNMDVLADECFVFENVYVTQPVCWLAWTNIMTGLYPHTTGVIQINISLSPETFAITEMVSSDYVCGYMGKWHLGNEIWAQRGFARVL